MKKRELKKYALKASKRVKREMKCYHEHGKHKGMILKLDCGLCHNIYSGILELCGGTSVFSSELDNIIAPYFTSWKHYSGVIQFPIPPENKGDSALSYYHSDGKYKDRQYKMRLKLIKHIIKCLKKDLAAA